MRQSPRFLIVRGLLTSILVALAAGSPAALGQETGTPDPAACDTSAAALSSEAVPAGATRELLFTTTIDSTGFAGEDPETGDDVPALSAVTSIVCLAPNTEIETEVEGAPNSPDVSQYYTTTLIVLEGTLELMLIEECASPLDGGDCEVTEGTATFRTADERTASRPISDEEFTPIPAGGIVVLADVTIAIRTGDSGARLLSTGVSADPTGGGACPTGCGRWKFP